MIDRPLGLTLNTQTSGIPINLPLWRHQIPVSSLVVIISDAYLSSHPEFETGPIIVKSTRILNEGRLPVLCRRSDLVITIQLEATGQLPSLFETVEHCWLPLWAVFAQTTPSTSDRIYLDGIRSCGKPKGISAANVTS